MIRAFVLLCLSSLFFFMSFNMILPDIFNFLTDLGGADYKGWVIFLFTLTAAISRPFSGRIADRLGRIPVILFGSMTSALGAIAYLFIPNISHLLLGLSPIIIFFMIRLFHGLSTGFKPTGTAALIADIIPENKRGQALGWFGFAGSLGMGIGPSIGAQIKLSFGYDWLFISSALMAVASALVVLIIPETLEASQRKPLSKDLIKVNFDDFYEKRVAWPAWVFLLYAFSFGAVFTLLPDKQESLGITNKGSFFTIYILITAVVRVISGHLSDRVGRIPIIKVGFWMVFAAMIALAFADSKALLYLSAVIYGLAHGTATPAIYAWVTDLADKEHRGRAFATMYIGMEIGIGIGALVSAAIYNNVYSNFRAAFLVALAVAVLGFLLLIKDRLRLKSKS